MQKNNSINKAKSTNANKAKTSGESRTTNRKANKNTDRSANSKSSSGKRKQNTAESKKKFLYIIPAIIWMVFIFYMSGKTGQESSGQSGKRSMSQSRFYNRSIAVLISLLYACSDEMHQLLVPGRSGKMIDVGIDMAGVLIVLICMILSKNTKWKIICGVLLGVLLVAAFVALLFVPF